MIDKLIAGILLFGPFAILGWLFTRPALSPRRHPWIYYLGAAVFAFALFVTRGCATRQEVDGVRVGMTEDEVRDVMGVPYSRGTRIDGFQMIWLDWSGKGSYYVLFNPDGKVVGIHEYFD